MSTRMYEIISRCNGLALEPIHDDSGWWLSQKPLAPIWTEDWKSQLWQLRSAGGGFVAIWSYWARVLDVPYASFDPGITVGLFDTYHGGENQLWQMALVGGNLADSGGRSYIIVPRSGAINSLVLDVPGFSSEPGCPIQQFPYNGGINQQWSLEEFTVDWGP